MKTRVLPVLHAVPDDASIVEASHVLRDGGLVAFPTETVYGLGAVAGNELAVRKIFEAKGRPSAIPLIVHALSIEHARTYFAVTTDAAIAIARAHWPGPVTLVLDRSKLVPDAVTAGGETVGVRVPDHPVALALIEALGDAIAAPSANPHDRLPPVRAQHVIDGLSGRIDVVLDGGRCPGGLESTVVDARTVPVIVKRRGAVETESLGVAALQVPSDRTEPVEEGWLRVGDAIDFPVWASENAGVKVGHVDRAVFGRVSTDDARTYAMEMYDALHELWADGCERVWVDAPPRGRSWDSIWDRLTRLSRLIKSSDSAL